MKGRSTLILLGLLIALSAYVYIIEYKGKEKKEKAVELASRVSLWSKEEISGLILKQAGEVIRFQREGENWRIITPVHTDADKYAADELVSAVTSSVIEREILAEDLAAFGLAIPSYTLILEKSGSITDTLYFGEKNPTGTYFFMRRSGEDRVILTGTSLETHLKKTLFDFRDKSVLPFQKADVRELKFESRGKRVSLEKKGNDWIINSPIQTKADNNTVEGILNKLSSARAKSFESESAENLRRFGLQKPGMTLTLIIGELKSQKQLFLGSEKESDRYFARDGSRSAVFTVDSTLYYELHKTLFDLRDKRIVHFSRDDVKSIAIMMSAGPAFICTRDTSDNWTIEKPEVRKARNWKISNFLSSLENLNATRFIGQGITDHPKYGFSRPQLEIILKEGADSILQLSIGNRTRDGVYVVNRMTGMIYEIEKNHIENLTPVLSEWAEENINAEDSTTK